VIPIDAVSQYLDSQYPRQTSPNAIAIALQANVADVQTALNRLVVLKRVLQVSAAGSSSVAYQGSTALVKRQLDTVYPHSTTAANIASILGLTPTVVQSDLDRLVVLTQAAKVQLPVTGAIQYISTTVKSS
jgi:hypothetical protein